MTATINEHGMLLIQANTPLESYALNKWVEENFDFQNKADYKTSNITINVGIEKLNEQAKP